MLVVSIQGFSTSSKAAKFNLIWNDEFVFQFQEFRGRLLRKKWYSSLELRTYEENMSCRNRFDHAKRQLCPSSHPLYPLSPSLRAPHHPLPIPLAYQSWKNSFLRIQKLSIPDGWTDWQTNQWTDRYSHIEIWGHIKKQIFVDFLLRIHDFTLHFQFVRWCFGRLVDNAMGSFSHSTINGLVLHRTPVQWLVTCDL